MHPNPKRVVPIVVLVALLAAAAYYVVPILTDDGVFTVSGTVEANEVRLAAERGGRVEQVFVEEGDTVQRDEVLAEIHPNTGSSARERIRSPLDGVVLYRSIEPGEIAAPGAPLLTVADLSDLSLTVYVPEDRYGRIVLGENYPVTVDSFPGEAFTGTVRHISDKAEFTPRNVQTTDSRKTTVFAIRLDLPPESGKLKPGMPADVQFPDHE
jgi:HlyD family secretion protein